MKPTSSGAMPLVGAATMSATGGRLTIDASISTVAVPTAPPSSVTVRVAV